MRRVKANAKYEKNKKRYFSGNGNAIKGEFGGGGGEQISCNIIQKVAC